jgi:hypothetical protein
MNPAYGEFVSLSTAPKLSPSESKYSLQESLPATAFLGGREKDGMDRSNSLVWSSLPKKFPQIMFATSFTQSSMSSLVICPVSNPNKL